MGQDKLNIAALIGSRICHDLISPIGAINNGLELLEMTGTSSGPEMELISQSVENASARIRFFRIAFGAASDQPMGHADVDSILRDHMAGSRFELDYRPQDSQPRWAVQMAFLGIQCLETALVYGGRIEVDRSDDGWMLTGSSPRIACEPKFWDVLRGGSAQGLGAAQVQFALLPAVAAEAKCKVTFEHAEGDHIRLRFQGQDAAIK